MEQTFKNILYQGLGMVSIAKDKVEKAVAEMVERGKMTREEGKKFYDELTDETQKAGIEFKETLKDSVREWIEKSGTPSRDEFEALKKRIEALENEKASTTKM
jgi:polyhydroxyalkanoate synthesis regulator phasin